MTLIRSRRLGPLSPRTVLETALATPFGALLGPAPPVRNPRTTDIRIVEVTHAFEDSSTARRIVRQTDRRRRLTVEHRLRVAGSGPRA